MNTTSVIGVEPTSPALPEGVRINSREPRCEKCLAPLGAGASPVCRSCGWYAGAGTFIEIDRAWEGDEDAQPAPRGGLSQLPAWAWIAIASGLAVIIESIVVRVATPDGSFLRTTWSGAQWLLGLVAFLACQLVGFIVLMRSDSTVAIFDVLLKPFKISAVLFRELPKRLWIVNAGICGPIAMLAAMLIIGSVPYHVLWTWDVNYWSSQGLEDAVANQGGPAGPPRKVKQELARKEIDCLIIGYQLNDKGNISSVLVARERNGRLRYVGSVVPTGDPALMFELREQLVGATQKSSVMPMKFTANWVAPKYACRISYGGEQKNKNLTDIEWEGDVRILRMAR